MTLTCARFLPSTTQASTTDPRFDSTKTTTFTAWKYNLSTATGAYTVQTLAAVTKDAFGLVAGGALTAIAALMW